MVKINNNYLVSSFLIAPFFLIIVIVDIYFYGGWLKAYLPSDIIGEISQIIIFRIIFGQVHVIASFITIMDKEYLITYRKKLFMIAVIALAVTSWVYFGEAVAFAFILLLRNYHMVLQIVGLSTPLLKDHSPYFEKWKWSVMLYHTLLTIVFFEIYFKFISVPFANNLLLPSLIISIYYSYKVSKNSKTRIGRFYVIGNQFALFTSFLLLRADYGLLLILLDSIIHQLPAFMCYFTHDYNRNLNKNHNFLYRLFFTNAKFGIPLRIAIPTSALLITCLYHEYLRTIPWVLQLMLMANVGHYLIEGVIWRNGTPHRKHLSFS